MQTIYYTTSNFITHRDNVVDLTEYRRRLELTRHDSLAPRLEEFSPAQDLQPTPHLEELPPPQSRSSRLLRGSAWALDLGASLAVVVMTLSFALQVLL